MNDLSSNKAKIGNLIPIAKAIDSCMDYLMGSGQQDNPSWIPSGFPAIDMITNGLETSSLITIAGRPGMGKTALALDIALNNGFSSNKPTVIFSYEMSKEQILMRLLSKISSVPLYDITNRRLTEQDLKTITDAATELYKAKILIDDSYSYTAEEIRETCLRVHPGLVCIDCFQMINNAFPPDTPIYDEISAILKNTAEQISAPVICLSQLPRSLETRDDKRPVLADIYSGIQEYSDVVIGLYRDNYYNFRDINCSPDSAEVIVLKNRWGNTGTARLAWNNESASFHNIS